MSSLLRVNEIRTTSGNVRRFQTYAIICDEKSSNTDGGTFSSGAWRTRDLNTKIFDPDNIVSISSNQFTLNAGSYFIKAYASATEVNRHQTRLYNVTGSSVVEVGSSEYTSSSAGYAGNKSFVNARVTITGSTAFELQHRCHTSRSNDGYGLGADWGNPRFSMVEIYKEG